MRAVMQPIYAAFREMAPAIEAFAHRHQLAVERYRRDAANWTLRFARVTGGEASIVISYRESTGHVFDISAIWWIDDYDARSRRLKSAKIGTYFRREPPDALTRLLDEALARVRGWSEADLGRPLGPYQWKVSRPEWEADLARLPRL